MAKKLTAFQKRSQKRLLGIKKGKKETARVWAARTDAATPKRHFTPAQIAASEKKLEAARIKRNAYIKKTNARTADIDRDVAAYTAKRARQESEARKRAQRLKKANRRPVTRK